jgi:methionyl-tRNA formyltransferase
MRLVFCGTPQFAVPTLEALVGSSHSVELVISQPDRPSGRKLEVQPGAVKRVAQQRGLPIVQPEKIRYNDPLQNQLRAIAPDVIIVVAYGRLIPAWMLELPPYGNLNLHASLLPKYRGAAPIQWAIADGETETGVSTMRIDAGLDTGDILLQERVPISSEQTALELASILAEVGAKLMLRTLDGLEAGTLQARAQEHALATLAPILHREDGHVDFSRTANQIYDRWRGFQPWPGAFSFLQGKKLVFHSVKIAADVSCEGLPGTLKRAENRSLVACGQHTCLELLEVQMEGKRRMPVAAFLNGFTFTPGDRLE